MKANRSPEEVASIIKEATEAEIRIKSLISDCRRMLDELKKRDDLVLHAGVQWLYFNKNSNEYIHISNYILINGWPILIKDKIIRSDH